MTLISDLSAPSLVGAPLSTADALLDPVLFVETLLGSTTWRGSRAILRSVAAHQRTAIKACHSSSKTYTAAQAVLWWVTRFPDGVVITTAPTWTQVEKLLWGEIHKASRWIGDGGSCLVRYPHLNITELKISPGRYAMGLSTDKGVRFQGFHGTVLIVVDEAPGVSSDIWEAIEGIRAGGNVHILALGNPVSIGGPFYDAFTGGGWGWNTLTISAFSTPNLALSAGDLPYLCGQGLCDDLGRLLIPDVQLGVGVINSKNEALIDPGYRSQSREMGVGRPLTLIELLSLPHERIDSSVLPYLTLRSWVVEKFREWGAGDPRWESRVLGQFPRQSEFSLIPLALLEAAALRTEDELRRNLAGIPEPTDENPVESAERALELKEELSDALDDLTADTVGIPPIKEAPRVPRVSDVSALPDLGDWEAGIDVAGPGENETTLVIRHGGHIVKICGWEMQDPRREVVDELAPYLGVLQSESIKVDAVGMGYYFALHMCDMFGKARVVFVNVGERALDPEKYVNLKAELFWGLRMRFLAGHVSGLTDKKALSQLSVIRYSHNARGQTRIEGKDDLAKRGIDSPDRAEGVMLAFGRLTYSLVVAGPPSDEYLRRASEWASGGGTSHWAPGGGGTPGSVGVGSGGSRWLQDSGVGSGGEGSSGGLLLPTAEEGLGEYLSRWL